MASIYVVSRKITFRPKLYSIIRAKRLEIRKSLRVSSNKGRHLLSVTVINIMWWFFQSLGTVVFLNFLIPWATTFHFWPNAKSNNYVALIHRAFLDILILPLWKNICQLRGVFMKIFGSILDHEIRQNSFSIRVKKPNLLF